MRGKCLLTTAIVVLLAGCGSTRIVRIAGPTTTVTVTRYSTSYSTSYATRTARAQTQIETVSAASAPAATSHPYPISFESAFLQTCTANSDAATCECILRHIEASEPYSTMAAAFHDIAIGDAPTWFTDAQDSCAGQ